MAALLIARTRGISQTLFQAKPSWKPASAVRSAGTTSSSARPLTALYSNPTSVTHITSPFMTIGSHVRLYSGRDARRAQRQATQTQVREREWEPTNSEVVPVNEKPVRICPVVFFQKIRCWSCFTLRTRYSDDRLLSIQPTPYQQAQQEQKTTWSDMNQDRNPHATTESLMCVPCEAQLSELSSLPICEAHLVLLCAVSSPLFSLVLNHMCRS